MRYKVPGILDDLFIKSNRVPATKEEIRVLTISKARLREGSYVIDIGCGIGSLTVEAALQVAPTGRVFAVDKEEEAIRLTKENAVRFGVEDIVTCVHGKAPEVIHNLPIVDTIIIGGGLSQDVIRVSAKKLKVNGRIVINAILLETSHTALIELRKLNFKDLEVLQAFIAKGREVGTKMMMIARNPITIISATKG
ncbi:MAG: precorrin-6Y C5,15-methyltransferase (decarboxylating) subunit CbiT [archaeon]|nr:precorrin-6Y C5,15-methyltransferase (decarboxylating) subunit CbiT [archaeon]MCP8306522.1 precorrin-6Y C5,15-methyltransferase (decarboxylating) subunit CbiT [archaeon]